MKKFLLILLLLCIGLVGLWICYSSHNLIGECDYIYKKTNELNGKIFYKNTPITGYVCRYYPNGNGYYADSFVEGIKDGISKEYRKYYKQGMFLIGEQSYVQGKLDGIVKRYDYVFSENSWEKIVIREAFYNRDKADFIRDYYKSGQLEKEELFDNGSKYITRYYYDNGRMKAEYPYKNGVIEGVVKYYNEDGRTKQETIYKNDVRDGYSRIYADRGGLWGQVLYADDKPVSGSCGDGRVLTSAELINWENGYTVSCGVFR